MAAFEGSRAFPFINLEKALGRAKELYDADQRGNEMPISGAFAVWKYSDKSSGGFQTVAALKLYGLVEDAGSKEARKLKLTKPALEYFRDEREVERAQKLKDFATNPGLFRTLFNAYWGAQTPDDVIARSQLKIDAELNEQSARTALGIYKENIAFANLKGRATGEEPGHPPGSGKPTPTKIKVGDYVQWVSNGAEQFKPVRKVTKVEGDFAWVHGSNTGIPMQELTLSDAPAPKPVFEVGKAMQAEPSERGAGPSDDAPQIDVLLTGKRLQITADVDASGLIKLKEVLAKYEEILKLLQ